MESVLARGNVAKSRLGAACGEGVLTTMKSQQAVAIRFVGRRVIDSTCLFFVSAARNAAAEIDREESQCGAVIAPDVQLACR
jgi:hypothetical protein